MISHPNQKIVTVKREMPKDSKGNKRPYITAYKDVIEEASRVLKKPSAFKLYMYLISNQDSFLMALSPQDFADTYGLSLDSAKDAVNNLIDNGYLVQEGGKNRYSFYEKRHLTVEEFEPLVKKTKIFTNQITKEEIEMTYDEVIERFGKENGDKLWRKSK